MIASQSLFTILKALGPFSYDYLLISADKNNDGLSLIVEFIYVNEKCRY